MSIHFFLPFVSIMEDNNKIDFFSVEESDEIDYDTFPIDDFIEVQILDDDELENRVEITAESKPKNSTLSPAKVWNFFTKTQEIIKDSNRNEKIDNYILCNIGQCHLSSSNSTSTLVRHLKAKHNEDYKQLQLQKSGLEEVEPWSLEIQKEKHVFLINWIIVDQQPFTVVENQQFQKFVFSIQPRYKLPSRHFVKEMIIQKFTNARMQINNYLKLSKSKVSLTMDMWTSISALGILAATIYYINDDWILEHFVLDVIYLPSPHNALAIKTAVIEIVNNLDISNRLMGITSDNEAKMIAATRQIGLELNLQEFQHYRCAVHVLNLAVEAALSVGVIPESLKKLRVFISIIRHSPKQMDKLKEYFRIENTTFKMPLPDNTTRWNYTYYMIDRALEIKALLIHLVPNLPSLTNNWPNDEEWIVLTNLVKLLEPFAMVTKVISASNYPTIGEVKWLFWAIKIHLEKTYDQLQQQVNEMKRVFLNYFEVMDKALHVPAFFDPRYKNSAYGNMSKEDILFPIRNAMVSYKEATITNTIITDTQNTRPQLMKLSASETRSYFKNFFTNTQQVVIDELDNYFHSNSPEDNIAPLEWWKTHNVEYPILSVMAKNYLSIMSTSVPCEQFFSIAGKQITQTRNRLHPDTIQACLCLKSWLEQGKIE